MKQKNLIFEALAYDEKAKTSPSLGVTRIKGDRVFEIYIKNAVISLISAKRYNPDTSVGLVINIELEEQWKKMLEDNGIIVWVCPFESFRMPQGMVYSLSYYKLCAFDYILKHTDFEKICFVDCDTISFKNYKDIWVECEDALLIVPNDEPYYAKVRKEINGLYNQLFNEDKQTLTHFASGFIIGARDTLVNVIQQCHNVYERLMALPQLSAEGGDEIVWSIALADYEGVIRSPKAYCLLSFASATSYWIDKQDYTDENVVMWHLPADKRYSMIWAYNWFEKHGEVPPMEKMAKASRFRHVKPRLSLLALQAVMLDGDSIKRNIKKLIARD